MVMSRACSLSIMLWYLASGHVFGSLVTTTCVSGSSSLNGTAWGIVAPKHMPAFVAALLSEYFFVLDVLEFYRTQNDAPLLESAIRIEIRVDLHRHFGCLKRMFLLCLHGGSTYCSYMFLFAWAPRPAPGPPRPLRAR